VSERKEEREERRFGRGEKESVVVIRIGRD
jgi:hypothetical protein